eukprot:1158947-Pelagomonas_calceolata.AAC.9
MHVDPAFRGRWRYMKGHAYGRCQWVQAEWSRGAEGAKVGSKNNPKKPQPRVICHTLPRTWTKHPCPALTAQCDSSD